MTKFTRKTMISLSPDVYDAVVQEWANRKMANVANFSISSIIDEILRAHFLPAAPKEPTI